MIDKSKIIHGFIKDKSHITNSSAHVKKRFILNLDIKNYFESFHFARVFGYFQKNNNFLFPHDLSLYFTRLLCLNGSLPQGAPTSPFISNLIFLIIDMKILKLTKRYNLLYTRYADDLTFSTNNGEFRNNYENFILELSILLKNNGFNLNESKTRFLDYTKSQRVTGLTVNKKLGVGKYYYKQTRAMAHHLYTKAYFEIQGEEGNINKLEGRFNYIDQIDKYNNILVDGDLVTKKVNKTKCNKNLLNGRELEYQKFLFYRNFLKPKRPLVVTEGQTDIMYIKAALKKLIDKYRGIISYNESTANYNYKFSFLNKTKNKEYLMYLNKEGAGIFKHIFDMYSNKNKLLIKNYYNYFNNKLKIEPSNPVVLLFDNELGDSNKPIIQFINYITTDNNEGKREEIKNYLMEHGYCTNLFNTNIQLLLIPNDGRTDFEIENLIINDNSTNSKFISLGLNNDNKMEVSRIIYNNYRDYNFDSFKPLLDKLVIIFKEFQMRNNN